MNKPIEVNKEPIKKIEEQELMEVIEEPIEVN